MATGTSGYIESIHTRPEPMKPNSTLSNLRIVGAFANLAGAGVGMYNGMAKNDFNTFKKEYDTSVEGIKQTYSDPIQQQQKITEFDKAYQSTRLNDAMPETQKLFADAFDTNALKLSSLVSGQRKAKQIADTSSYLVDSYLQAKKDGANIKIDDFIKNAYDFESNSGATYTLPELGESTVSKLVLKSASTVKDKALTPTVEAFNAKVRQTEVLLNDLATSPVFGDDNSSILAATRNKDLRATLSSSIKLRETELVEENTKVLDGIAGEMASGNFKNTVDTKKAIESLYKLGKSTIANQYSKTFEEARIAGDITKRLEAGEIVPAELINNSKYKGKLESVILNKAARAMATGNVKTLGTYFEKYPTILKKFADEGNTRITSGSVTEFMQRASIVEQVPAALYNKMVSNESKLLIDLLPNMIQEEGVTIQQALQGDEKALAVFNDKRTSLLSTMSKGSGELGKEMLIKKGDAISTLEKTFTKNPNAIAFSKQYFNSIFNATQDVDKAMKLAEKAAERSFPTVSEIGVDVTSMPSSRLVDAEYMNNIKGYLTDMKGFSNFDNVSMKALPNGNVLVSQTDNTGMPVRLTTLGTQTLTDLEDVYGTTNTGTTEEDRSSPEILKLKSNIGNRLSSLVQGPTAIATMTGELYDRGVGALEQGITELNKLNPWEGMFGDRGKQAINQLSEWGAGYLNKLFDTEINTGLQASEISQQTIEANQGTATVQKELSAGITFSKQELYDFYEKMNVDSMSPVNDKLVELMVEDDYSVIKELWNSVDDSSFKSNMTYLEGDYEHTDIVGVQTTPYGINREARGKEIAEYADSINKDVNGLDNNDYLNLSKKIFKDIDTKASNKSEAYNKLPKKQQFIVQSAEYNTGDTYYGLAKELDNYNNEPTLNNLEKVVKQSSRLTEGSRNEGLDNRAVKELIIGGVIDINNKDHIDILNRVLPKWNKDKL